MLFSAGFVNQRPRGHTIVRYDKDYIAFSLFPRSFSKTATYLHGRRSLLPSQHISSITPSNPILRSRNQNDHLSIFTSTPPSITYNNSNAIQHLHLCTPNWASSGRSHPAPQHCHRQAHRHQRSNIHNLRIIRSLKQAGRPLILCPALQSTQRIGSRIWPQPNQRPPSSAASEARERHKCACCAQLDSHQAHHPLNDQRQGDSNLQDRTSKRLRSPSTFKQACRICCSQGIQQRHHHHASDLPHLHLVQRRPSAHSDQHPSHEQVRRSLLIAATNPDAFCTPELKRAFQRSIDLRTAVASATTVDDFHFDLDVDFYQDFDSNCGTAAD